MRKIKSRLSEKILLKGLGFTFGRALRLMLFSMTFTAAGLCVFCTVSRLSFDSASRELTARISSTLVSIAGLSDADDELKASVICRGKLNLNDLDRVGAVDMDINRKTPLTRIKAQRRSVTENMSVIRYVRADTD